MKTGAFNKKRSAKAATSPGKQSTVTSVTLVDIDEWDRREMWENAIEACVYQVLRLAHPQPLTAEQIVLKLKERKSINTKDEVGDALYDGALRHYVYRTGEAPDRFWHLKVK
jgi:hypothetical protein